MKHFVRLTHRVQLTVLAALFCLACSSVVAHDQVPGTPQTQPIALKNVTVYPVVGDVIENAVLVFENGKITAIGADVAVPAGSRVIDGAGRRVYPSFIESWSYLGLREVGSVKATQDYEESGDINPNLHAQKAVNPDSELIPVARVNGIGLAISRPRGLVGGQAALMRLDGWSYEDMTLAAQTAMVMSWPSSRAAFFPWLPEKRREELKKERDKKLSDLEDFFQQAQHYRQAMAAAKAGKAPMPRPNPRLDAMQAALAGTQPVWIEADRSDEIHEALDFAQRYGLKMVLVSGHQADQALEQLKRYQVPVILVRTQDLPVRRDESYDHVYRLPAILHEAGVPFAIAIGSTMGNDRNLPYQAAAAVAYGLDPAAALASITLAPAQIIGVADRVGSLEVGKDATLFLCDGDPLEITTQVSAMFIEGAEVDLNNKQKMLYDKYKTRIERHQNAR